MLTKEQLRILWERNVEALYNLEDVNTETLRVHCIYIYRLACGETYPITRHINYKPGLPFEKLIKMTMREAMTILIGSHVVCVLPKTKEYWKEIIKDVPPEGVEPTLTSS